MEQVNTQPDRIEIRRAFNLGNYESHTPTFSTTVQPGETLVDAHARLLNQIDQAHQNVLAMLEERHNIIATWSRKEERAARQAREAERRYNQLRTLVQTGQEKLAEIALVLASLQVEYDIPDYLREPLPPLVEALEALNKPAPVETVQFDGGEFAEPELDDADQDDDDDVEADEDD